MEIIIIAAMAANRVIGKNNALPWSLREDMSHFRELTIGWPCIMGRRTWESLPKKPLPGRLNVIVTRTLDAGVFAKNSPSAQAEVQTASSLRIALERCAGYERVFICGGESVYREALPLADTIELTVIHQNYEGDAFFPKIDPGAWVQARVKNFDNFSFISYSKKSNLL